MRSVCWTSQLILLLAIAVSGCATNNPLGGSRWSHSVAPPLPTTANTATQTASTTGGATAARTLPAPIVAARFFTSPSELRDELAVHEILPRLYAGVEVEGQSGYVKQGSDSSNDSYFDSVTGALRWVPFYGLNVALEGNYDLQNSDGFTLDEATVTLGAVPTVPWYLTVGRTNLPFGEFNSHFREDPAIQILGEIQGNEIAGGYDSDKFEVTAAIRHGRSGSNAYSVVGNVTFSPVQDMDVGVYWTNDITTSVEIKQLNQDRQDLNLATSGSRAAVGGAGTFVSLQKNRYSVDFEFVTALKKFDAGFIADDSKRPWAWDLEATIRPTPLWEVGIRLEQSADVTDSPKFQFGIETSYGFGPHAAISVEVLHAKFDGGASDRNMITAGLVMRW